ncbi:hypothetical protein AALO_G00295070, partial [Alosa alosa]
PGCDVDSRGHPDVEGDEEGGEQSVKWIRLEARYLDIHQISEYLIRHSLIHGWDKCRDQIPCIVCIYVRCMMPGELQDPLTQGVHTVERFRKRLLSVCVHHSDLSQGVFLSERQKNSDFRSISLQ